MFFKRVKILQSYCQSSTAPFLRHSVYMVYGWRLTKLLWAFRLCCMFISDICCILPTIRTVNIAIQILFEKGLCKLPLTCHISRFNYKTSVILDRQQSFDMSTINLVLTSFISIICTRGYSSLTLRLHVAASSFWNFFLATVFYCNKTTKHGARKQCMRLSIQWLHVHHLGH